MRWRNRSRRASVFAVGRWLRCGQSLPGLQRRSASCLLGDNPRGFEYLHQDWVNHYVDVMRFVPVDRKVIVDSAEHEPIKSNRVLTKLPFTSARRGQCPWSDSCPASDAAAREPMSRTLRLEALVGEYYRAMAEQKSSSDRQVTTTLSHVNVWVKDSIGSTSVSNAKGTFSLPTRCASS